MRKILLAIALLLGASPAFAQNYQATQGSGTTFGSKLVSSVNYPMIVFCDPTTPTQCVAVNASGQLTVIGASSNASSAVATSSTNLGTISYNYGFNGTTWDQLQVDASKFLKTTVAAALPAGTNLMGKVGIDQTTVGTTNAVSVAQVGANTVLTGNGVTGTGSQRVTIASDNTAFSVNATLQASGSTAIGKVDPNTIGSWGLQASTQNSATPTNGALALGQFNTTPTTITTGNVSPLQMDSAGNLLVNIKAGAGSGGTALADNSAFTQSTTSETPMGCLYISSYVAATSGRSTIPQCDSTGHLLTANAQAVVTAGNTLNAVVANTTGTSVPVTGYNSALVNVNCSVNCTGGTQVNFQASDIVGFQTVGAMPVAGGSAMVTSVTNQSGAAMFCIPNMGYTNMRANVASYSAGTISVTITPTNNASCDVSQVANSNPNGSATSANSSPVVIASDQAAVAVKAASGAFASGSIASGALASGSIAAGAVSAGAYVSGSVLSGAYASGSLASGAVVDLTNLSTPIAPNTATATKGILLGGQFDSTQKTLTNGQQAGVSLSSRGAVYVATGADTFTVTGSGGTFPVTGATSNASSGVATGSVSVPTIGYLYGFNGTTWDQLQVDASKFLKTTVAAALPAGTNLMGKVGIDQTTPGTTNAVQANVVSGGIASGAVASGAIASGAIASGAYATGSFSNVAATKAASTAPAAADLAIVVNQSPNTGDPCSFANAKTSANISSALGTFAVVTGVSAKKIYVCSLFIISPSAVSVSLAEGSSSTCGTSAQAAVIGVATNGTAANGVPLAANGGWTLGNGGGTIAATATNANYLCIFQSGTAQLAGNLTYVQQ